MDTFSIYVAIRRPPVAREDCRSVTIRWFTEADRRAMCEAAEERHVLADMEQAECRERPEGGGIPATPAMLRGFDLRWRDRKAGQEDT